MIKWAPFAVMPEQYERINAFIENQNKITMPLCRMIDSIF